MFLLRRILRLILLGYALYSFAYGIWLIIQTENTSPEEAQNSYALEEYGTTIPPRPNHTPETKSYDRAANDYVKSGLRVAAIAVYEFIAAWRSDQASFSSIAVVRVLLYAIFNRVWTWGVGWPTVDDNLVVFAVAVEAAML